MDLYPSNQKRLYGPCLLLGHMLCATQKGHNSAFRSERNVTLVSVPHTHGVITPLDPTIAPQHWIIIYMEPVVT